MSKKRKYTWRESCAFLLLTYLQVVLADSYNQRAFSITYIIVILKKTEHESSCLSSWYRLIILKKDYEKL